MLITQATLSFVIMNDVYFLLFVFLSLPNFNSKDCYFGNQKKSVIYIRNYANLLSIIRFISC